MVNVTNRRIVIIQVDEVDAGYLLGLLIETAEQVPGALRERSPWVRLRTVVADSLVQAEGTNGRVAHQVEA